MMSPETRKQIMWREHEQLWAPSVRSVQGKVLDWRKVRKVATEGTEGTKEKEVNHG